MHVFGDDLADCALDRRLDAAPSLGPMLGLVLAPSHVLVSSLCLESIPDESA